MADSGQKLAAPRAPTVSVVMPTFQRRELVKRAIASVMAQSYRDFELIVIDDGSTDGTREALEALDGLDGRLRYRWQPNRGVAAARNAALEMGRGEIVAFLDSDDRWLPDHLAVVVEVLARHPDTVAVSTCPAFILAGRERVRDAKLVDYRDEGLLDSATAGFIPCIAIRRQAIVAAGEFDERLGAMEDSDLLRRLGTLGPFALIKRRTVVAQTTSGSLRERARRTGRYLAAAEISAENLASAVGRLPEGERSRLEDEPRGAIHLARAMRALDRGEVESLRAELLQACRWISLSSAPRVVAHRLREHQPRFSDRVERLGLLETLAEAWPERQALTARYLRAWAIGLALRLRRPGDAARLIGGWRLPGTAGFIWHVTPVVRRRIRRSLQDRRNRGLESGALRGQEEAAPGEQPAVSVVIPTHQRRELVCQAVASVMAQSYRDFELIVIDDGSTDGTREALEALDGLDGRLRYRWQPNRGVAAARNAGLEMARGSIAAFLDSDNLWEPNHLETVIEALDRHPEADLCFTRLRAAKAGHRAETKVRAPASALLVGNIVSMTSGVAVRRGAALSAGGFDERMSVAEDADLWLRLALRGSRFAIAPGPTVIKRVLPGSLIQKRRGGDYSTSLEIGAARAISELERGQVPESTRRLPRARGRRAFASALRALARGDEEAARRALEQACRLLPELSQRPRTVISHLRYDLPESAPRAVVGRRLAAAARLWPDRDCPTAHSLAAEAAIELFRSGRVGAAIGALDGAPGRGRFSLLAGEVPLALRSRRRQAWRRRLERARGARAPGAAAVYGQRLILRSGAGPLALVWRGVYEALARLAAGYLAAGTGASPYVKGSLGQGDPVWGVSDIDLVVVVADGPEGAGAEARIRRRWRRLSAALPTLSRALFERPRVYHRDELGATTLTHETGLQRSSSTSEMGVAPAWRERRRRRGGAERPGLYGPGADWRLIRGRDRVGPLRLWPLRADIPVAAWMELQYWWLQAFRAAASAEAPWRRLLCVKLVTEPARIWLWTAHGERIQDRAQLFERAIARLPDEEPALRAALDWERSLRRKAGAPLEQAVAAMTRISTRIARRLAVTAEQEGSTEVLLRWSGPDELIAVHPGASRIATLLDGGAPGEPLPLADWRARVLSAPPDEVIALLPGGPHPDLLGAAAAADEPGVHPALLAEDLLILPSLKGARLRGIQSALTDPVSFALLAAEERASFPNQPGWSAQDSARRAVAEHLGWLLERGDRADPEAQSLGRLFTAARAAHFLESVEAGEPELDLTVAAVARRMAEIPAVGKTIADQALGELRGWKLEGAPVSAETVDSLRAAVGRLPAYSLAVEA